MKPVYTDDGRMINLDRVNYAFINSNIAKWTISCKFSDSSRIDYGNYDSMESAILGLKELFGTPNEVK